MFELKFETNNDAFAEYCDQEVINILTGLIERINNEGAVDLDYQVRDSNGNTIGSVHSKIETNHEFYCDECDRKFVEKTLVTEGANCPECDDNIERR